MSDETNENQNEDLKAFEAALGALQPRTDRLDCRWQSLSAAIASEAEGNGRPSCSNPLGHQFVCIHCGNDAPIPCVVHRWAWPASLSAMTAIAAALLVMLVTRSEPQVAVSASKQNAASSVVQQHATPTAPEKERVLEDWLAMGNVSYPPCDSRADEMCYLTLRDQVLRDGVDSWKSPVSPVVTTTRKAEAPLNYREQLNRLLEQQGLRGS